MIFDCFGLINAHVVKIRFNITKVPHRANVSFELISFIFFNENLPFLEGEITLNLKVGVEVVVLQEVD